MKNTFDMMTDVRSLINVASITSLINGGIWIEKKPDNSEKVDLVINAITISNDQFQVGAGNVNIHSPTVLQTVNGKQSKFPDYAKLSILVKELEAVLDAKYKLSFSTEVGDRSGKIYEDDDGSFFANVPFIYRSYNKNYKNI